jgi:hypothetical protein
LAKKTASDIERVARRIIRLVSGLNIDDSYKVGVFGALLTRHLMMDSPPVAGKEKKTTKSSKPASLSDRILGLRDKGFFKQPRTDIDVHAAITKNYPCVRNRVSVQLIRLANQHELRRTEGIRNRKKVVAYAW